MHDDDQLVSKLVLAAEAAIRREAPTLGLDLHRVRGLGLDFELVGDQVRGCRAYVERSAPRGDGRADG